MTRSGLVYMPVHTRRARVETLHAIHSDIAHSRVGIDRMHHRQRHKGTAVALPRLQHRQAAHIDLRITINGMLTSTASRYLLRKPPRHLGQQRQRAQLIHKRTLRSERLAQKGCYTVGNVVQTLHTQSQSHTAVGTHHIGYDGKLRTRILEQQSLSAALALGHAVGDLGYLEPRRHLRHHAQQLAATFQLYDIIPQTPVHGSEFIYMFTYSASCASSSHIHAHKRIV